VWIGAVTLFPEMFGIASSGGVVSRALHGGGVRLSTYNPRDFTRDRHRTVDDRPYGGGAGMVMIAPPLLAAIEAAKAAAAAEGIGPCPVICLSPQGERFSQQRAQEFSRWPAMVLLCGRYEGIDQRVLDQAVDLELSVGDYVVSGGELPALIVIDAVVRLLPGTLGNAASAVEESHLDGLLDYPQYTRPEITGGRGVPAPLLSGDHAAVARWRRKAALLATWRRRPDLLTGRPLGEEDRRLLTELLAEREGG